MSKPNLLSVVATALGLQKSAPEKAPEKKAPPAAGGSVAEKKAAEEIETVALMAWQAPASNVRLLVAYVPGTDPSDPTKLVAVNVRSNVNFTRHLKLRARRVPGSLNTYDLVGPCPRWKGRY